MLVVCLFAIFSLLFLVFVFVLDSYWFGPCVLCLFLVFFVVLLCLLFASSILVIMMILICSMMTMALALTVAMASTLTIMFGITRSLCIRTSYNIHHAGVGSGEPGKWRHGADLELRKFCLAEGQAASRSSATGTLVQPQRQARGGRCLQCGVRQPPRWRIHRRNSRARYDGGLRERRFPCCEIV